MTSILNVSSACGAKGSFGVGTGDTSNYSANFLSPVIVPKDSNGNVKPGYTLQSSTTTATGLDWSFTGANGKTVVTYQYPTNCPIPFPSPIDLSADLVLITREDPITGNAGITDLYMPTLGVQGVIPVHSIPPICDVANQLVFYFDDANAAVNVYQKETNTWRMGWLRAVPTFDFTWRAAEVLTDDKIATGGNAYAAPYNSRGLFFSSVSSRYTNQQAQTKDLNVNPPAITYLPGFYFINYTVTNGNIDAWDPVTNFTIVTGTTFVDDLAVCAITTVNQNGAQWRSPTFYGGVDDIVCAVAVNVTSVMTSNLYGWWGFLAHTTPGGYFLANPNLTDVATVTPNNFRMDVGQVTTISIDSDTLYTIFLGGNYTDLKFNNVVVTRSWACTGGPFTQKAAVAMQYNYTGDAAMTSANYVFIGQNGTTLATSRDWTGRITQSNYANDFFAYGGNFQSPPSTAIVTTQAGYNPLSAPFIAVAPEQPALAPRPYASITIPSEIKGGIISNLDVLFLDNGTAFNQDGNVYGLNNFAVGISPNDGDLRQSSFPPVVVGGNFLQPSAYFPTKTSLKFQTSAPIVASDWWFSVIQFYVGEAKATGTYVRAYLYPDSVFNKAQAPLQWWQYLPTLVKGENYINVYGDGTALNGQLPNNSGGTRLNSNVRIGGGDFSIFTLPRTWFLELEFTNATDTAPEGIAIGRNPFNQKLYTGCWNLYGYPTTGITATSAGSGLFSSRALQLGLTPGNTQAKATQSVPSPNRRVVSYTNLTEPVPLNVFNYNIFIVPLNWQFDLATYSVESAGLQFSDMVVRLTFSEDRQGDFGFSVMNLSRVPSVIYGVPQLISSEAISPSFSLRINNRYEVYKSAWGNSDKVALGVYTNFQEVSDLQYVLYSNGTAVDGIANSGRAAFSTPTSLVVNTYYPDQTPPAFSTILQVGDILVMTNAASPLTKIIYQVTGAVTQVAAPTYTATIPVSLISGTPIAVFPTNILLDLILSKTPTQTPFVLKDNLGPYLIGNGSSPTTLRDVYLASNDASGKAFRYVPDYQGSFLSFQSFIFVGSPTVDNTVLADTVLFNTNSSAILLSKASNAYGGEEFWNVVNTYGNIGFNNQYI